MDEYVIPIFVSSAFHLSYLLWYMVLYGLSHLFLQFRIVKWSMQLILLIL